MKYYKITNKRLTLYKSAIAFQESIVETWNDYIKRLISIKNDKGVRLVPDFSEIFLSGQGPIYMLPKIAAFRFKCQIQLKAIRDKIWTQTRTNGVYMLGGRDRSSVSYAKVNHLLNEYTKSVTIYDFYSNLFKLERVPFGSKDGPEEVNKAFEEKIKELCAAGTDPVILLVPRFFVTTDDTPVIGLPEQMPYVKEIKTFIDKGWMQPCEEEEAKKLYETRKNIFDLRTDDQEKES